MLQAAPIRSHMDRGRGKEKKNPFSTWSNYFNPMKSNRLEGVKNDNIFRIKSEFLEPGGRHVRQGPSDLMQNGSEKNAIST